MKLAINATEDQAKSVLRLRWGRNSLTGTKLNGLVRHCGRSSTVDAVGVKGWRRKGNACMRRNTQGYRIGQDHHRAKLSDEQVEAIRQMRDEGMSYRRIAEAIGAPLWTVRDIADYRTRL